MSNTLRALNERPIAYYPIYRDITGSTTAGILLSQLMYWFSKQDIFFKTDAEMLEETHLTEREFRTAKSIIKKIPFISVYLQGIPAKTYYEIDWDMYQTTLDESSDLKQTNRPISDSQNDETINEQVKKTTPENTPKIKKDKKRSIFSLTRSTSYENLSAEYKQRLYAYAVIQDGAHQHEDFKNYHIGKGGGYKNWSAAYNTWIKNQIGYSKGTYKPEQYRDEVTDHPSSDLAYISYKGGRVFSKDYEDLGTVTVKVHEIEPEKAIQRHHRPVLDIVQGLSENMQKEYR